MTEIRTKSSTGGEKGVKLARFDLIPAGPLKELAEHYGRGARKYANHQWRQGYEWSKSIAALARHFNDFMAGKDYDVCSNDPNGCRHTDMDGEPFETGEPDTCFNHTGSHHMVAVAWHSFLLLEFKDTHKAHDDRYKGEPEPEPEFDPQAIALEILADHGPFAPQIFPGDPDEPDLDQEARTEQPIQVMLEHPRPFDPTYFDRPPTPPAAGAMARCEVKPVLAEPEVFTLKDKDGDWWVYNGRWGIVQEDGEIKHLAHYDRYDLDAGTVRIKSWHGVKKKSKPIQQIAAAPVFHVNLNSVTQDQVQASVLNAARRAALAPRYREGLLGGPARLTD